MGRPKKIDNEDKSASPAQPTLQKLERDENGLVVGVEYKFDENGLIDWKAMIPKQFLYVNNGIDRRAEIEKKYGKPYKEIDLIEDNVDDSDLIISLAGIKYLLRLRGFISVKATPKEASADYAAVTCQITFRGNYETEGEIRTIEDNACAHFNNTTSFYSKYLVEAATNRAFCRCVRNFLGISIVSKEELGSDSRGPQDNDESNTNERETKLNILQKEMDKRQMSWEQLKQKISKAQSEKGSYKEVDLEKTNGIEDLPNDIVFDITSKLKKANK